MGVSRGLRPPCLRAATPCAAPCAAPLYRRRVLAHVSIQCANPATSRAFYKAVLVFGDAAVAGAMIDRLVHHATVVNLKGDSYRLKNRDLGRVPTDDAA